MSIVALASTLEAGILGTRAHMHLVDLSCQHRGHLFFDSASFAATIAVVRAVERAGPTRPEAFREEARDL